MTETFLDAALPDEKFDQLIDVIRQYGKIAVAFSGGVDSTLTLHAAVTALGGGRVVACYARSQLNSTDTIAGTLATFADNFPADVRLHEIEIDPLRWSDFVMNTEDRCYLCKKRMYAVLGEAMAAEGYPVLADGTNCDDLRENRPGLRAIREMQVKTPLAEVGLTKAEIRILARRAGLSNFDLPSNSCLATRIPHGSHVAEDILRIIESAERFLHRRGFLGCRVRPGDASFLVEIREKDFAAFVEADNRRAVQGYFETLRSGTISLSITGR